MKLPKHRVPFKLLAGYFILGILATISGVLVLSEIKTFTQLQREDSTDRSKIVKVGSLIANIYENESLARAAIQLNSSEKFNEYVYENQQLLLKIDSLNFIANNGSQEFILDSIKLVINNKLKNITDLKNLKINDNSGESLNTAINKLSSIDPFLGKISITDFVENPQSLDIKTRKNLEEYVGILNKYNPQDSINSIDQKHIDSLLSISKNMLKDAQKETNKQRISLQKKERELIENDLTISRKLQELLTSLEKGIIIYSKNINKQREKTLNRSTNIILFAAGISFIIIIIFSIIFLNDFWKSQRYRAKLEQANKTTSSLLKSREQLISMVSHDLRTPLSTITGYSELLQKSTKSFKDKNYVEHIQNASTYMGQLVDDLLEFSKLENNTVSIETIPFNLENLINEIGETGKNLVQDEPINIIIKHDKTIENQIVSDPFRMKQILYNLVTNACKFTNEGSITIESVLLPNNNKNLLQILVSDTGIGINKEEQKNIFKAFTQANNTKESKKNGFGLGLTISKKLAELLGGTLTLKSELGKGSSFSLKIPITLSEQSLDEKKLVATQKKYNLKAMVVEDDTSMQQLIKELLNQYNIEVHVFDNAQSALETVDNMPFDLVLTDIQLPKMNGIHFMEILKNHQSYKNQPIVAMTGRSNLSIEDYIKSGFSEVLIKPFNNSKLDCILQCFFDDELFERTHKILIEELIKPNGFSIKTLSSFLNNDTDAIKKTLDIFLEDTKKNILILKQAKKDNDIDTFNSVSHRMLSMFKQLEVNKVVPFLELFEISTRIDDKLFIDFETNLSHFLEALETYLNARST
ncbi:signal transduction histidine kinase [Mariniflexile fucanivorans]|uniref:histidine kinase n=1 Tax=Mariniflexile fucanivorans TaxID=264023 RepID=A0A4R1RKI6_9FLAO|nr:ATP-binding protein [Mariniflexile fucanivorans]TCL66711.1 signal transduction histidine kinase [Mariniflexile fucanivorans]